MEQQELNSKKYWDNKFRGEWKTHQGDQQTKYFAQLVLRMLPKWLKEKIAEEKYDICDLGCANGVALESYQEAFPDSALYGIDFSLNAIKQAKLDHPDYTFYEDNILSPTTEKKFSVIIVSNVMEHFDYSEHVFDKLLHYADKYIIALIPYMEDKTLGFYYPINEHQTVFHSDNIPLNLNNYSLVYAATTDCREENQDYYLGRQSLLVYTCDPQMKNLRFLSEISELIYTDRLYDEQETAKKIKNEVLNLNQELTATNISLNEEKVKYENLYQYSANRDQEYWNIINSRSYCFFVKYLKHPMKLCYRVAFKFYRILCATFTINFSALKKEFKSPWLKLKTKIAKTVGKNKILRNLAQSVENKRVIVLPPTLDWSMPLFQRPQQLALSYSKKPNTVVIYVTKNIQYDNIVVAEQVQENLWVVNELLLDMLAQTLHGARETILSLSWTPNKYYLDKIHPDKLIYEYIDELEIFHMYGPEMEKDHLELLQKADITVCTATKLYNKVVDRAKNAIVSTNAGDYDFFVNTQSFEINSLLKGKIEGYSCVLGYYGALAKWFDYELIKQVAERKKDWLWLLVGINYDGTLDRSGILELENVLYIPPQPYKELPSFLKAFDIATIPFVINEITLSTSPVKLFEYMAAGKPILTSKMPECLKYRSVATYRDADEFITFAENYLKLVKEDSYWETLKKEALENTWDNKTQQILKALSK
jgi:teichuronic acid biosynthesis glycosyltransferase TuaH